MQVYELKSDSEEYQNFNPVDMERDFDSLLERKPIRAEWLPMPIRVIVDEASGYDSSTRPAPDFTTTSVMPIFSRRAVEALGETLTRDGEVLPLLYEEKAGIYFAFNPLREVDAVDEARSEIERFKSSGRVMHIDRYEFCPEKIDGASVFRIPQQRARLYVTDEFVRRVEEAGLIGFDFVPLWSSVAEPVAA